MALALLVGCSSGGGTAANTTTTTSTTSTTVATTTTTTKPEDAVKEAYLAYWKMLDRLFPAPDPDDPEIAALTVDPLLSFLRDDLATRKSEGRTTRFPADPALNSHRIDSVVITETTAIVSDCFVDGRIAVAADGTENAAVVTKRTQGTLLLQGGKWLVSDVRFLEKTDGVSGCAV